MKKILLLCVIFINSLLFSQQNRIVGGYMPFYESITGNNLNHYNYLYYAFAFAGLDGSVQLLGDPNKFTQFLSVTSTTSAKRMISVCTQGFAAMAVNSVARKSFATNLRLFCVNNNLNGIDIDWEGVNNNTDKANYTAMMNDLRLELNGSNLEFSQTVSFGDYAMQWYENVALQQADFLQIAVYDAAGTWAASPNGNHSSFDHFLQAETYWVGRGFTRNKLVMGLPFYGYRFNNGQGGLADGIAYKDILAKFPNALPSDNLLIDSTGDYWFNGVDLIKQKINYANSNGFKGVFVWEIGQDNVNHPLSLDNALSEVAIYNLSVPGAPSIGTAVRGNARATVNFTAPSSNGGSAITSYTATSSPGNFTTTGLANPLVVLGLTNGTAYTFTVKATNTIGTGAASANSNSVIPVDPNVPQTAAPMPPNRLPSDVISIFGGTAPSSGRLMKPKK